VQKDIDSLVKGENLSLYRQLTRNFAEFTQALPASNTSQFGSVLEEGLHRALYVLQLQKQESHDNDPLTNYMIYSAALLYDVAKVAEEHTVFISKIDGEAVRIWLPHEGPLTQSAEYYRVRRGGGIGAWLGRKVTPILAHTLMPKDGYDWLAKNPKMLNIWLALLTDDHAGAEGFDLLLNKAELRLHRLLKAGKFAQLDIDKLEPEGTKAAEAFLDWLREGLKNGTIKINDKDGLVHMTESGLFLQLAALVALFIRLASRYNMKYNAAQVYDQFKKLGIAPVVAGEYVITQAVDRAAEAESTHNLTKSSMFAEHSHKGETRGAIAGKISTVAAKGRAQQGLKSSANIIQSAVKAKGAALAASVVGSARRIAGNLGLAQRKELTVASTILKEGVVVGSRLVELIVASRPQIAKSFQVVAETLPQTSQTQLFAEAAHRAAPRPQPYSGGKG